MSNQMSQNSGNSLILTMLFLIVCSGMILSMLENVMLDQQMSKNYEDLLRTQGDRLHSV